MGGRTVMVPHGRQNDRYRQVRRPWPFIDPASPIINPENGRPPIVVPPDLHPDHFNLAIMV